MSADGALSGVCGLAFAVELEERAHENRVSSARGAIIPLEGRGGLARHIGPARRQVGVHRVAEIFHAPPSVGEIRNPVQVPPAAVACGDRAKRPLGFADDVKPAPQSAAEVMGTRRVKREVAGIADRLPLIERAGSLQHDGRDLPLALAHMGLEPGRNARLSRRKRGPRARERDQDTRGRRVRRRRNPNGNDPVSSIRAASAECRRPRPLAKFDFDHQKLMN